MYISHFIKQVRNRDGVGLDVIFWLCLSVLTELRTFRFCIKCFEREREGGEREREGERERDLSLFRISTICCVFRFFMSVL